MSSSPADRLDLLAYKTLILFGLVSVLLYFLVLRPIVQQPQQQPGRQRQPPKPSKPPATRQPPHVATQAQEGGFNVLADGLVTFRNTHAAAVDTSAHRKDRARLLTRLVEVGPLSAPPSKGHTMVLSLPQDQLEDPTVRQVCFLLGTYYSLLVVVVVPDDGISKETRAELVQALRSPVVTADIIPDHRILFASSVVGRVALVRQLQRVEVVIDFDPEVHANLTRFGHTVVTVDPISSLLDS